MSEVGATFEKALKHHHAGELDAAETLYREIVRVDPHHADARHLLGVTAHQRDQHVAAVDHITKAIQLDNASALYHSNLGASYRALGDLNSAIDSFREAVRISPEFFGAHYNLGMALQARDEFEQAITCYQEAIRIEPAFFDAYNNLGQLFSQQSRFREAIDCYRKVVEAVPESAEMHYNLANAYHGDGQLNPAVDCYRDALELKADFTEAHNNLGLVLRDLGQVEDAVASFTTAIECHPAHVEAHRNLGHLLTNCGRTEEAIHHLRQASLHQPESADIRCNLADALRAHGQYNEAKTSYREALAIDPQHIDALYGLGYVALSEGKHDEARDQYEKLLAIEPNHVLALNNLGSLLSTREEFDGAADCFGRVVDSQPENPEAHYNLGNARKDRDELESAAGCYRRALELDPNLKAAHINLGVVLKQQGELKEAIASHRRALRIDPLDAEAHFHLSLALLLAGELEEGWSEYEWRWKYDAQPREFQHAVWEGSSLAGKKLFVYSEQGVGDEILFASCLPEILGQTSKCVVECDERLVALFRRSFPLAQIVARPAGTTDEHPSLRSDIDYQVAAASLPLHLRPNIESFPQIRRFLVPDPERLEKWRARYRDLGDGLKVGISWKGGAKAATKRRRSIPLEQWRNLLGVPDAQFINLQYGNESEELSALREKTGLTIPSWDDADPLADLDDWAAQIAALDLVISVDNSTVHMAGALGVPVWAMLPYSPNWRWLMDGENSHWYTTAKLFRQPRAGEWQSVLQSATAELQQLISPTEPKAEVEAEADSEIDHEAAAEKRKYEHIWTHDEYRIMSPGLLNIDKMPLIEELRNHEVETILDAGCGSGKLMQKMMTDYSSEFRVRGFDISANCLDPFFDDIKNDILTVGCLWDPADFCQDYDAIICTDVLEHIPTEHIPRVLENFQIRARKMCYLAIALFPDGFGPHLLGEPLHLTVKEPHWWFTQFTLAGMSVYNHAVEKTKEGQLLWLHAFLTV